MMSSNEDDNLNDLEGIVFDDENDEELLTMAMDEHERKARQVYPETQQSLQMGAGVALLEGWASFVDAHTITVKTTDGSAVIR